MTDRRLPLRTWLAGVVLALATVAFAVPAQASLCPLLPDWCSCSSCSKNPDCTCRLREGGSSGISCQYYLDNAGCNGLQAATDAPVAPETAEAEMTLEQLLAVEEPTEASSPEACF